MSEISSADCVVLGSFPSAPPRAWFEQLTEQDRDTYRRVQQALNSICGTAVSKYPDMKAVPTSGFSLKSGVRGQRPKDLWCAAVTLNSHLFVGMPQVYIIASQRGVEIGFAAAVHRSDFSDASVGRRLKEVIPSLFDLLPSPQSNVADELNASLAASPGWHYQKKARLLPGDDFATLAEFLADLRSDAGASRGSGSIARYYSPAALDDPSLNLHDEFAKALSIFRPLVDFISGRYRFAEDSLKVDLELSALAGPSEPPAPSPTSAGDERKRVLAAIVRRRGQRRFRLRLLLAYQGACAISGTTALETLEAAHIVPYNGEDTNATHNGLLLRADLHTLFDLGCLYLDDDYKVRVRDDVVDPGYRAFHLKQIALPQEFYDRPSKQALAYHRKEIAEAE